MKLASLNYNDEKKKFNYKIIPASYFNSNLIIKDNIISKEEMIDIKPKLDLKIDQKSTSRLSLKSIERKEGANELSTNDIIQEPSDNAPYTELDIIALWQKYSEIMEENGRYNIASILRIDKPKLSNETINITLPNSTNKIELESVKIEILDYFKENLKNKSIYLNINVDEGVEKKFIYTDQDKYDLMKKKNPDIEILKNSFNINV